MIDGATAVYGLVGETIKRSFSPVMHNAGFQHFNLNAAYLPFPVVMAKREQIISSLDVLGIKGANITIPYKTTVIEQLDQLDSYAVKIGSVNTIYKTAHGWHGTSTDGYGILQAIAELGIDLTTVQTLLLGAGGAARAIAFALCEHEVKKIYIKNRSYQKELALVQELKKYFTTAECYQPHLSPDLIINATSVGTDGLSMPLAEEIVAQASFVIDIIYQDTPLLAYARLKGAKVQNGIPMLVHQAIESFRIWTGCAAPVEIFKRALSAAQ